MSQQLQVDHIWHRVLQQPGTDAIWTSSLSRLDLSWAPSSLGQLLWRVCSGAGVWLHIHHSPHCWYNWSSIDLLSHHQCLLFGIIFQTQNHLTFSHMVYMPASSLSIRVMGWQDSRCFGFAVPVVCEKTQKCVNSLWRQMQWLISAEWRAAPQDWILVSQKCNSTTVFWECERLLYLKTQIDKKSHHKASHTHHY